MSAATKHAAKKNLQELVPLNELSEASFREIAPKIVIEEVRSGHFLFRKGDQDNQSFYLLHGKVDLLDGDKKVTGAVEAGTDVSRHPVANHQPRMLSARAAGKVVIARIESMLLDAHLNWDRTSVAEATEIVADDDEDWMTRILKSEAFIKIPPAVLQRLIISMKPFPVSAGDVVIRQGDEGDYFYSIDKGRCAVTRRDSPDGKDVLLSELSSGDFFGEESLLLSTRRNATITMLTDGLLMCLKKADFIGLLQKHLVKSVRYEDACSMVEQGAVWIDVRTEDEYADDAIEDSVNIPLDELRDQIPELVFNAKYVICCDTGHRSVSAAFVLSHKGFEAYVLDGGLNALKERADTETRKDTPGAAAGSAAAARPGAEIVAFAHGRKAEATEPPGMGPERSLPGGAGVVVDAAEIEALEALRNEIDVLRQADRARQEAESRLFELQTEFANQRDLIVASGRKIDALHAELQAASEERRLLQEQHDAELKSRAEQIGRLENELEASVTLASGLRAEIASVEQNRYQLQQAMDGAEADHDARFSKLEDELSRITRERDELQMALTTGQENTVRLEGEYARYRDEQIRLQENFREELAQAQQRFESLHAELLQKTQQHSEFETNLQQQLRTVDSLNVELDASRRKVSALETELAAERQRQQVLGDDAGAELARRIAELEDLQGELARIRQRESELAGQITGKEIESQGVIQQYDELSARYEQLQLESGQQTQQLQQRLDASLTEKQRLDEQLASLRLVHESLQTEAEQLRSRNNEQAALLEGLTADKQSAEQEIARLQDEWNSERATLKDELEAAGRSVADLEDRIEQSGEDAARERQKLQAEMQSRLDAYGEQLEQRDREAEELQTEAKRTSEALQSLTSERDELQTRLDQALREGEVQRSKLEELNALVESLRDAAEGHSRELGEQLESLSARAADAESKVDALRADLSGQHEKEAGLLVDIEALRNQEQELREQLQAADERYRTHDLENQEALGKVYDDLTRKNETERELQGQIERLRKKLDQSDEALQAARHEARESLENIRSELNAERRARADERAQMAARQRELKEQLVSVASQHEEVIATRDGVVAQARSDAREEERTRLGEVIAMQAQMEQQLATLQSELQQAHEETEAAVLRERGSYEADLELALRQKADATAALGQLESQLRQLMEERDAALAERQSVHEQLGALRAEVEVARGLVNADRQGSEGDPIRLISELKETRRNIEIAVRLRTEAESQRDQALAQLDELRQARIGAGSPDVSPDVEGDPGQGPMKQPLPPRTMGNPGVPRAGQSVAETRTPSPAETNTGRGRMWKIWVGGLGAAVIAAFVFWLTNHVEIPAEIPPGARELGAALSTTAADDTAKNEPAPVREAPVTGDVSADVDARDAGGPYAHPDAETPQNSAANEKVAKGLAAGRSFRDALASGGSGPLMVELPAADYLMGSAGNSLNFEERPQHSVQLHAFAIGRYEVSFAEYDRFAQATGRRLPHDEGWGRADRPVINVSWNDALAYANWLSEQTGHHYRLPSEAEWEFAARGGSTSSFWWEGIMRENPANCFDCGSRWDGTSTSPVGSFQGNKFGIHDTAGNVEEWTQDCFHPNYTNAPSDGSAWQSPGCTRRVVRGGSYTSPLDSVRSARRGQYEQDTRLDNLGFRVVRVD